MPQDGLSLLPGDLNSTNEIIVGVLELLEGTLDDENITDVAPQVSPYICVCMGGKEVHKTYFTTAFCFLLDLQQQIC